MLDAMHATLQESSQERSNIRLINRCGLFADRSLVTASAIVTSQSAEMQYRETARNGEKEREREREQDPNVTRLSAKRMRLRWRRNDLAGDIHVERSNDDIILAGQLAARAFNVARIEGSTWRLGRADEIFSDQPARQ